MQRRISQQDVTRLDTIHEVDTAVVDTTGVETIGFSVAIAADNGGHQEDSQELSAPDSDKPGRRCDIAMVLPCCIQQRVRRSSSTSLATQPPTSRGPHTCEYRDWNLNCESLGSDIEPFNVRIREAGDQGSPSRHVTVLFHPCSKKVAWAALRLLYGDNVEVVGDRGAGEASNLAVKLDMSIHCASETVVGDLRGEFGADWETIVRAHLRADPAREILVFVNKVPTNDSASPTSRSTLSSSTLSGSTLSGSTWSDTTWSGSTIANG